jgi:hypothetical protein
MSSDHSGSDSAVRELLDKEAIRDVLYKYARGNNRADRELLRSAYHDDSWEEHGGFSGPGHAWADLPWRQAPGRKMVHHGILQSLIELDGDVAYVETYFICHLRTSRPIGPDGGFAVFADGDKGQVREDEQEFTSLMLGRYLDRFERRDGTWAIAVRKVVMDWAQEEPGPRDYPILERYLVGSRFPEDLVYHMREFERPN